MEKSGGRRGRGNGDGVAMISDDGAVVGDEVAPQGVMEYWW